MKGEKGSLINRIKDWFRIKKQRKLKKEQNINQLKRKKKKKLRKKEKERILATAQIQTYNRFQIIGRISIGLFLGFFETLITPQKKEVTVMTDDQLKKDQDALIKLEQSIRRLETSLKENTISVGEAMDQLKEQQEAYKIYENRYMDAVPSIEPFESKEKQKASMIVEHQNFLDRISTVQYRIESMLETEQEKTPVESVQITQKEPEQKLEPSLSKETTINPLKDILKGVALAPIVLVTNKVKTREETDAKNRVLRKKELIATRERYLTPEEIELLNKMEPENIVEVIQEKVKGDETKRKSIELYLKEFKKSFDDLSYDWKEYQEWVHKTTREKDTDRKKYAVEILKNRIRDIQKEYLKRSNEGLFLGFEHDVELSKLDPKNILENGTAIDDFLAQCEMELSLLNGNHRKEVKDEKEKQEKHEKLKPKRELEQEKEDEKEENLEKMNYQDRQLLELSIEKNIQEQEEEIEKIKDLFRQAERVKKRTSFLGGFTKFLKNTIQLGLTALPIKLLKNPTIGILGSTIILNNRIRGMRKLINKQNAALSYINYKEIERQISDQRSLNITTQAILEDTASQLKHLKIEFFWEFSYDLEQHPEIEQIKHQFISIETQIAEKNKQLQTMFEHLNEMNEKNEKAKQKILNRKDSKGNLAA